ncbi:hypothetical protein MASR1M101_03500 [Gemmatimonas sp.]
MLVAALVLTGCHRIPFGRSRDAIASASPSLPRIPRDAARFEIDSVTDSTATFRVREAQWVRPGLQSYVVDPQQRDALVARLRLIARDSANATALVTGQVARVKVDHFLLVVRPTSRWWQSRTFWAGTLLGASVGAGGVLVAR